MPLLNQSLNGKSAQPQTFVSDDPTFPVNSLALAEDGTMLQNWLTNQIAERLGIEPDEIDVHEDFADYGLNSIEAVNLSGDLENLLGDGSRRQFCGIILIFISCLNIWHKIPRKIPSADLNARGFPPKKPNNC
jgi:aryl carrier-like protein